MKIAIVDYGSGNLRSVSKAIEKIAPISTQVLVTGDPEEVLKADRVVFPGQGAMPDCMKNLRTTGMEEAVRDAIRNKPFFAVCVGEQMLFEHSEEGDTPGLGIFPGKVIRIPTALKIPHMGWNSLALRTPCPLLADAGGQYVYFVHSFYGKDCDESLLATSEYGIPVTASAANENVMGCQFHPEKSGEVGLRILKAFSEI